MSAISIRGRVVTEHGVLDGGVLVLDGGRIHAVDREPPISTKLQDFGGSYLLPGFVDPQINGSFGVDVATEPDRLCEISARLPSTGVTSYLPTVISSPAETYPDILSRLDLDGPGAEALGVHLEGPFLNPEKRGAHEWRNVTSPDPDFLAELLHLAPIRMLTLAPELKGAPGLIQSCVRHGVAVSVGHSDASFTEASQAFEAGVSGVTHLFNAMRPLHHRDPGLSGAALASGSIICGMILDGKHVHPEMLRLAYRLLGPERLYLTTDAISATGLSMAEASHGARTLAGQPLEISGGRSRLADGSLAGSTLTMDEALRNVISATGCTIADAAKMTSSTAADLIGVRDRKGKLAPGYDADVVAISPDLTVEAVWKFGERLGL